ncbi:hypothetical protein N0V84_009556 [Fusarium piperis]|uniref:Uncharacterized protein n=1 Tax=Fusarium piperis TaxID=1435070 RepID=A0A9W9BK07_9HYPO|nr:hypothetical protein N0V84_009556 [Fusarium piperis]
MTSAPTPIISSPEGVIKTVDDLDHWVKQLRKCRETEEKTAEVQYFFWDFDVSLSTISGMRNVWVIAMEDILTLEKKLRDTFAPLDRAVTKLRRDIGAHPDAKRWIREAEASTWRMLLDSMPRSPNHSPIQVLVANYERIRALSLKVQPGSLSNIQQQVQSLGDDSCELHESNELSGGKLSRKAGKHLSEGINAVASRGNMLYDLFLQVSQRVNRLDKLLNISSNDRQIAQGLEETMMRLMGVNVVSLADVKMIELELE